MGKLAVFRVALNTPNAMFDQYVIAVDEADAKAACGPFALGASRVCDIDKASLDAIAVISAWKKD